MGAAARSASNGGSITSASHLETAIHLEIATKIERMDEKTAPVRLTSAPQASPQHMARARATATGHSHWRRGHGGAAGPNSSTSGTIASRRVAWPKSSGMSCLMHGLIAIFMPETPSSGVARFAAGRLCAAPAAAQRRLVAQAHAGCAAPFMAPRRLGLVARVGGGRLGLACGPRPGDWEGSGGSICACACEYFDRGRARRSARQASHGNAAGLK